MTQLIAHDEINFQLRLSDLLSLHDAQFPAGACAMRPLDLEHVQQLVVSNQEHWPAVLVTRCSRGYILIDGYHRREAARLKQAEYLLATCQSYPDAYAVIDAAFRANLTHGLKASFSTRGDYAYWLHTSFPTLPQEKIAERAGLSQGAVSKAISKRQHADKQGVPTEQQDPCHEATQAARRLVKAAGQFLREVEHFSDEAVQEILSSKDRATLTRLTHLLGPAPTSSPLRLRQFFPPQGEHT